MCVKEAEAKARDVLEKASKAIQDYRKSHPPFTPVPEAMFDALDDARAKHDKAYDALLAAED